MELLVAIASAPTAPFREHRVASVVRRICRDHSLPMYTDPDGNLLLGVGSAAALARALDHETRRPLLVLSAHMDHPGFHGLRWNRFEAGTGGELEIMWFGDAPRGGVEGAPVWIADCETGWTASGRLDHPRYRPPGEDNLCGGVVCLDGDAPQKRIAPRRLFGGFEFRAPCWHTRRRLYGRSLDDLVGVYSLVELARAVLPGKVALDPSPPFVVLLTRAEEAAFVGMVGHLMRTPYHRARRPVRLISVDASRSGPGLKVGGGVVIRTGDRATVFDPATVAAVAGIADAALDGRARRRFAGSTTCEASVAVAFGLPAAGVAVATGRHHNRGVRGSGVAPEHVDLGDLADVGRLCRALVAEEAPWEGPFSERRKVLVEAYEGYSDLFA